VAQLFADMFHQLADNVGGAVGVAHVVALGAAELGIDVGVARHAVVLDRANQRVDAFAARWMMPVTPEARMTSDRALCSQISIS